MALIRALLCFKSVLSMIVRVSAIVETLTIIDKTGLKHNKARTVCMIQGILI